MKKLLLGLSLLVILFTNTLTAQCKFEITQQNINGFVVLGLKFQDSLKIKSLSWNNGKSEREMQAKENGKYCVKIEFTNGCKADGCIEINTIKKDTTCKVEIVKIVESNGKTRMCVRGANITNFTWSTGASGECINPEQSGQYCVRATNKNGCVVESCTVYSSPNNDTCSVKILKVPAIAGISRPSLCVVAPGNVKSLEWSNGSKDICLNPDKPGEYCVTVVYANGCIAKECVKVEDNTRKDTCKIEIVRGPSQAIGLNNLLCIVPVPGIKSVEWSNGSKERCITATKTGEYCVKVQFENGCTATSCIQFVMPPNPDTCKVGIAKTPGVNSLAPPLLCAVLNGLPLVIEWSNGSKELCMKPEKSGEYCVTVIYVNGCKAKYCTTVEVPVQKCEVTIESKKEDSGKTYLCATSKSKISRIVWATGDTTSCIEPKRSGEYCVTIQTADGCLAAKCFRYDAPSDGDSCKVSLIKAPNPLQLKTNLICAVVSGNVKNIEWSNGSKDRCIAPDKPGEYCVTVVYTNGCKAKACIKIEEPSQKCNVEITRKIEDNKTYLCATSGRQLLKYIKWSTGDTTNCIQPSRSGEYCVTIVTKEGCESKKCINYTVNNGINNNICNISISRQKRDGKLFLCAESSRPGNDNMVVWNDGTKGKCIEVKAAGRYCAQLTISGCEANACVTVDSSYINGFGQDTDISANESVNRKENNNTIVKISGFGPNPSIDYVFVDIKADIDHMAKIYLFDMTGNIVSKQDVSLLKGENTVEVNMNLLEKGVYQLNLINHQNMDSIKVVKAF